MVSEERRLYVSALAFVAVLGLMFAGCVQTPQNQGQTQATTSAGATANAGATEAASAAVAACVALCDNARIMECGSARLADCGPWIEGPCVSDARPNDMPAGWACDVAHNPRIPADDAPENQCQAYLKGSVKHFVEVTPECELIRAN